MLTLIEDKLAPVTFSAGFLNRPLSDVRDFFLTWKKQLYTSFAFSEIALPLQGALNELQPLTPIPRRWLLLPTTGDWVAYFDNCVRGPDPAPPVCYLSQKLACRGVVVRAVPHTLSDETGTKPGLYGIVQIEMFAPYQTKFLNYERSISVAYEGGKWSFEAVGTVQNFEEAENYQSRRIIDRFTPEMLKRYCYALGIRIDSPEFYQTPGVLCWTNDPLPAGHSALSLAQAQQQIGWRAP
jgi:hypothetical protein